VNYRHAFHAGNFADLVKHAVLLELLGRLTAGGGPLTVIDTHAGRGLYDLAGVEAKKSGEAAAGIVRLMAATDAPAEFGALTAAVAKLNKGGAVGRYPGSPWLIAGALRRGDRYIACELRPDEHGGLKTLMKDRANVETLCADGYQVAAQRTAPGRTLVLIDPPFERADDYARIVETAAAVRRKNRDAAVLIWLPLKDLETFDAFLRDLEDAVEAPLTVAEARMRPLTDPMKMNGCALVLVGGPDGLVPHFEAIAGWTARALGEGGAGRAYLLA
jgi:23S rRNA (adenine2030-N6)-methyltransferase